MKKMKMDMLDEEESTQEKIVISSDQELIEKFMQDCTELFKNYVYRYHPMVKEIDLIVTAKPYLDMEEGYIKNIPVKIAIKDGETLYEATPDEDRFRKVIK